MFCEECGTELEPGARFCENCGTPVPQENLSTASLASAHTEPQHQIYGLNENGVIVTDLSALSNQLGTSKETLTSLISEYTAFCLANGISYSLIDIANPDLEAVIKAISQNNRTSKLKYVFILGNEAVIPTMEYENQSQDGDKTISSDLPYSTLTIKSPFDGFEFSSRKMLRVGRLVSYQGESFEKFASYFRNTMKSSGAFSSIKPYGLSAKIWKRETDFEYQKVATNTKASNSLPDSSPAVTVSTVENFIPRDANLLMFNLHGSDKTKYWYGQEEDSYPEAVQPESLSVLSAPYIIGVEACYGANFCGNLDEEQSILVKSMQSGCLSLLGSSRIAYGTPEPEGNCADFMIGEYLKQIKNGETAGDSHIAGIRRVVKESEDFTDVEIKTIAEFNLFGDPALRIGDFAKSSEGSAGAGSAGTSSASAGSFTSSYKNSPRKSSFLTSIDVELPDIKRAVRQSLAQVDEKITSEINEHVYKHYADLRGCMPATYKIEGTNLFHSIYKKENGAGAASQINRVVKIYFDKSGKIKKELESK